MIEFITDSYTRAAKALLSVVENPVEINKTISASKIIADCFESGGKLLTAGNGGSICDAMHLAEEFTGRFRSNRRALPAIALADSSHITCVANDFGFDEIFSRGVEAFAHQGDVFVGLSTSGNSLNIIKAVEAARQKNMKIILMLGKDGGELKGQGDIEFIIAEETSDRIQEVHMVILHIIIEGVERLLFPENYLINK